MRQKKRFKYFVCANPRCRKRFRGAVSRARKACSHRCSAICRWANTGAYSVDREYFKRLYLDGKTWREIASVFNMRERSIVGYYAKKFGLPMRRKTPKRHSKSADYLATSMARAYLSGLTVRAIAEKFEVTKQYVLARLKDVGVKMRSWHCGFVHQRPWPTICTFEGCNRTVINRRSWCYRHLRERANLSTARSYTKRHRRRRVEPPIAEFKNPSGICQCGCGGSTAIIFENNRERGLYKGDHRLFIKGHNAWRKRIVA